MVTSKSTSIVPASDGFAPPATVSLFRQEVIEFQQIELQFGQVGLLQPLPLKVLSWLIAAAVAVSISFLVIGHYSRKATVSGYLTPTSGTAKIFALQRGTITKVLVTDGQEVQQKQPLLTVDTTQIADTGEDVNAAILSSLSNQQNQINQQISREEQRMESEKERLALVIQGLTNGISQLQAQIPLQQNRISIAEALVQSVAVLVQKGAVTDVEFKRRQSDLLDQRQALNSLGQQLATQQNNLTDAKYTLNQLPTATAEKIQLLRNDLATIEQRAAEINGKRAFVIRAPMAGRVTALQATAGKIAEPNQLQLEIVPTNSALRAELFVPSSAIGFVRVGQHVNIRYDAFPHQNFGRYGGDVSEISKDILTESDGPSSTPITLKEPSYRVTATLDRQDVDAYGSKLPLRAGMLLKADVILDRRSLMQWILDPLMSAKGGISE